MWKRSTHGKTAFREHSNVMPRRMVKARARNALNAEMNLFTVADARAVLTAAGQNAVDFADLSETNLDIIF